MNTLVLNIKFYFNLNLIKFFDYSIVIQNLYKYDLSYKHILIYLKNLLSSKIFNLKNKYNRTKSKNKHSKTYYSSSHNVRKGLVWVGFRNLKINSNITIYSKLLIMSLFNLRSNILIYSLEYLKFLYYINSLNNSRYKTLIINSLKYSNYTLNYSNNSLLLNLKKNNTLSVAY
uniref:Ribosomal protein L4 n=1 Tax=Babesia orientalis TaxID=273649 RepID=A0A0M4MTD6_9APIC|nr:ribosomal protein L4 [Babesia orientalis]ALE29361.1 ribosomal protein L4 [Babesia orientalis]